MGNKIILVTFFILGCQIITLAEAAKCSRPTLHRNQVFIYRTIGRVSVKVHRCLYNDSTSAYSDISDQCLSAFKTSKFLDKWDQMHNLRAANSPIVLEDYVTNADPLKNQIILRSGTTCRYDRGFCYDPSETITYAAVWDIVSIPSEICPKNLEQVFYGHVDFWTFTSENMKYLFYYDQLMDRSFALRLENYSRCHNKPVWYTNENGYIVSLFSLSQYVRPTKKLNQNYFPLQSKKITSEAILKDCDLHAYSLDFDQQIKSDYFNDPENLKSIFKLYQKYINTNKKSVEEFAKTLQKIKSFLESKNKNINDIKIILGLYKTEFEKINNSLSVINKDVKNPLNLKDFDKKFDDVHKNVTNVNGNIDRLENSLKDYKATLVNLQNNFANFKEKMDKDFLNIFHNISKQVQIDIKKLGNSNSKTETNIFKKLEPFVLSANNFSTICNEKINNFQNSFDTFLASFKRELFLNTTNMEKKINNYVDFADNNLLKKYNLTNLKIEDLKNQLRNYNTQNEDNIKLFSKTLENSTNNTINIQIHRNITADIQQKLNLLSKAIDNNKDSCNNEIRLLKDTFSTKDKNLREEINNINLVNLRNPFKILTEFNRTLLDKIASSDSKIQDLETQLNQQKQLTETNKNYTDHAINNLITNITLHSETLTKAPVIIEQTVLKKMNPLLDAVYKTRVTCSDNIEKLRKDTDEIVFNLKEELTYLFNLGDEIIVKDIVEAKKNILDRLNYGELNIKDLQNNLNVCKNFVEDNLHLTEEGLKQIRQNVSLLFDFINRESNKIDNTIQEKDKFILNILANKSNDCEEEIDLLKNQIEESISHQIKSVTEQLKKNDLAMLDKLNQTNSKLLNEINLSNLKIEVLVSELNELLFKDKHNNVQDKIKEIEDILALNNKTIIELPLKLKTKILENINPLLEYVTNNSNLEIKNFKDKVNLKFIEFHKSILNNFSSVDRTIETYNNSILQIKILQNRIEDLENKTKTIHSNSKTKNSLDSKVEYLLKQADSSYNSLQNNIDEVNILKTKTKELQGYVNDWESSQQTKNSYMVFLNQTIEQNAENIKHIEEDINNLKRTYNFSNFDILFNLQENSNNIKKLQKQLKEKDIQIDQLKVNYENNKQLLKIHEKSNIELKQNLSLSNIQISENNRIINDLKNQFDEIKNINKNNDLIFTTTISDFHNLINKKDKEILEIREELKLLTKCCNGNHFKLEEKDKELKVFEDETRRAITELKTIQQELKNYFVVPEAA